MGNSSESNHILIPSISLLNQMDVGYSTQLNKIFAHKLESKSKFENISSISKLQQLHVWIISLQLWFVWCL